MNEACWREYYGSAPGFISYIQCKSLYFMSQSLVISFSMLYDDIVSETKLTIDQFFYIPRANGLVVLLKSDTYIMMLAWLSLLDITVLIPPLNHR